MTPSETYTQLTVTINPSWWQKCAGRFIVPGVLITNDAAGLACFLRVFADGTFLFSTRPDRRRQGLATQLLRMAGPIDFSLSEYTPAGRACVDAYRAKLMTPVTQHC